MSLLNPGSLFGLLTLVYGLGACLPLVNPLWQRRLMGRWQVAPVHLSLAAALVGSLAAIWGAASALREPADWGTRRVVVAGADQVPYLPQLTLEVRLDALSAFFVLLIAGFTVVVAIYSFGALRAPHYRAQRARIASAFNLFAWATLVVVMVNDLLSLLIALELMTLAFGFLTLYKHTYYHFDAPVSRPACYHQPDAAAIKDARLAPQIYLIVSHTSTVFLLLASLLLAIGAGGVSFDALRLHAAQRSPLLATTVFLFALAGLGIRAGLVPAHFWVSLVHPASPTTTHAFSLGIAIKVAIYLMYRFFFQFLPPQAWWGYLLLAIAVITALVNVWYAIASHDLKKALAYHSIENIGIIGVGIGVALIYAPRNDDLGQWIVGLALAASLYHLLNHAIFKGLLYLCTGAIDDRTGQVVDIEHLGGLIRLWPWTSGAFLVGAVAIAGFPPLNGFIGEWLTVQALLHGVTTIRAQGIPFGGDLIGGVTLTLGLMLLVASFALTAFCFFKIAGLALLGAHRADAQTVDAWKMHSPTDVGAPMRSMMLVMALLCLVIGLLPGLVMPLLTDAVGATVGQPVIVSTGDLTRLTLSPPVQAQADAGQNTSASTRHPQPELVSPGLAVTPVIIVMLALGGVALAGAQTWRRQAIVRPRDPWNCGTPYVAQEAQYTGAALSFLIRDLIGAGLQSGEGRPGQEYLPAQLTMSEGSLTGQSRAPQVVTEIFRVGYNRVIGWLQGASTAIAGWGQNGDLGRYLLYILFANLTALLLFLVSRR